MCNRRPFSFSSVALLVVLLLSSVKCCDDALFTKVFIDETVKVPDLTSERIDGMMKEIEASPISTFCEFMARMYFLRCYTLDLSSAALLYSKCERTFETNFDFTPLLKKMSPRKLVYFAKMPPGRLRREMYQRLCEYDHFEPEFFGEFNRLINCVLPFETELIHDLIPWFNDNMTKINSGARRERITNLASWNIVKLTMPENFHRLRLLNWMCQWNNDDPISRPFPGMERHYTLSKLIKYLPDLTGEKLSESSQQKIIERIPHILIDGDEKMRQEWAMPFLKGIQQLRLGLNGRTVDLKAPQLCEYIEKALLFLEDGEFRDFLRYFFCMQTDVEDSFSAIGSLECPVFIDELSSDTCAHICQFASVPNDLNRSQQRSPFSSGPANPANFMNILTGHNDFEFFHQFDKYGKYMAEAQKKAVLYLAKFAYGEDLFSRLDLRFQRTRLLRPHYKDPIMNDKQDFLLHSLYFKIGAFEGLKSSIQTSFESMAFLFFPQQCSKLMAARKRFGIRPNIENLFIHPFVNKSWVLEMYCTKDINVQSSQSILRLTNIAVTKTEICNLVKYILSNLQQPTHEVRRELPALARIVSLLQFAAPFNHDNHLLNGVFADLKEYAPRLNALMTLKGDTLKDFAEALLHYTNIQYPLTIPVFVILWQVNCGEQPEINLSIHFAVKTVQTFITKLAKNQVPKDELPAMRKKLFCLLRLLAIYNYIRLDMFLEGMQLMPLELKAIIPDEIFRLGTEPEDKYEGLTREMIQQLESDSEQNFIHRNSMLAFVLNPVFVNAKICMLELIGCGMSPAMALQKIRDYFEHDTPVAEGYYDELVHFIANLPAWFGKKLELNGRTKNLSRLIRVDDKFYLVHEDITCRELYMMVAERYGHNDRMKITVKNFKIMLIPGDEVVPYGFEFSAVVSKVSTFGAFEML